MDPKAYWVGFNMVKGIGAVRLKALIDYFGDLAVAWQAPADALVAAGLSPKIVDHFLQVRKEVDLELALEKVHQKGIRVITWEDADYPTRLTEIDQKPPVLYLKGEILTEDGWAVAVVGTRRITTYGRQVAEELGAFLAGNGITVVSGLARGVDAVAHQACLNAGGRTIAVLGCGVDRVYPPEHQKLAQQIVEHGALVSDYAPGTPPDSANFPPRNRIISGLSLATIVVEAGEDSGALITAKFAVDQGRDVFAVPGNILAPQSRGANYLIQRGAHPLLAMKDVLDVLELTQVNEQRSARMVLPANDVEAQLLKVLSFEPLHMDEIHHRTGLSIEKVSATLSLMELKGLARQVGGMQYVAVRENQAEYREDR